MKKTLLGLVLLFVCSLSFAQERVDNSTLVSFDKSTKALRKVMGYSYDDYKGEWEETKNSISRYSLYDSQNFYKLTAKAVNYEGVVFYLLIVYQENIYESGYYRPRLNSLDLNFGYLFTASEFEQLFDLTNTEKEVYPFYKIDTYGEGDPIIVREDMLLYFDEIIEERIQIRMSDNGEMVRFLLPNSVPDNHFETNYYEMPKKKFYKWLEPIMPAGLDRSRFK